LEILKNHASQFIDVDVFEKVYETSEFRRIFNELVDTSQSMQQLPVHRVKDLRNGGRIA